jgi:hypothetical protein
VPTNFLGLIGYKNIAINGTSTSSYTFQSYLSFYLMLDVSGSMSFPSTTAEQQRLQAVNPDNYTLYPNGCTFACHFTSQGACGSSTERTGVPPSAYVSKYNPSPGGYCMGFTISRLGTTPAQCSSGNSSCPNLDPSKVNWGNSQVTSCGTAGTTSCIQLRADAVGYAVSQLLTYAQNNEAMTNQFQVGLYPFIQNLYTYVSMTTNLTGSIVSSAGNLASLLDTGVNTSLGSGGTHFENAFSSMNSLISTVGSGNSSSSPLPYTLHIPGHRRVAGLSDAIGRQLVVAELDGEFVGAVPEFGDNHSAELGDDDRLLHQDEESRHQDRRALYSLYDDPECDQFCLERRYLRQQQYSEHPDSVTGLRIAEFLLHRQHAGRHQQRADRDVQPGGQHRASVELTARAQARGPDRAPPLPVRAFDTLYDALRIGGENETARFYRDDECNRGLSARGASAGGGADLSHRRPVREPAYGIVFPADDRKPARARLRRRPEPGDRLV